MAADGGAFARLATIELPLGRYAVLVDAGYLISSAGELVLGTSRRRDLSVDVVGLIGSVMHQVVEHFGSDLVRIYWYDAARDRVPTVQQRQIASLPHVKLRLGNVNRAGVQKGVDALLRVDLVGLATTGAVRDVVLLAGDEDMLEAVESAQAHGVRVHLWGVEPPFGVNQAERLVWECDSVHVLGKDVVDGFVRARVAPGDRATREAMAKVAASIAAEPAADAELVATAEPVLPIGVPEAPHAPVEPVGPVPPADVEEAAAAEAPDRPTPAQVAAALGRPGRSAPARRPAVPAARTPTASEPVDLRTVVPRPDPAELAEVGGRVAGRWLVERGRDNLADLLPGPELPAVIEKELLVAAESEVGINLRGFADSREAVRRGFWERLFTEFGISLGVSDG